MDIKFYQDLIPLKDFQQVADLSRFRPLPSDWSIVISDIQGSTRAIEAGRYKEVNLIGAATIAAIKNSLGIHQFPFVFGGDGATILLPRELALSVSKPLTKLQRLADQQFGLTLRIGIVPYSEVTKRGGNIQVAKYEVSPNGYLAMFQGGGLQLAEALVKKDPEGQVFRLTADLTQGNPELQSLSCRWAPIQNRNGTIISLLVQACEPAHASGVYQRLLARIHPIFEDVTFRPVSLAKMKMEPFFQSLKREIELRKDLGKLGFFLRTIVPMIFTRMAHYLPSIPGLTPITQYLSATPGHSDYRKLDDILRMVLDCSHEQVSRLVEVLDHFHHQREIFYGIHYSETALMTCMVESLSPGGHIHFIDGSDGGYAMAAKNLKEQIRRSLTSTHVSAV